MSAPTHQLVKDVSALKQKKFRDERGQILVEGRHPIEEAVQAGLNLLHFFAQSDALPESLPQVTFSAEPFLVDDVTMSRMSSTSSPPPCLAVFEKPKTPAQLTGDLVLLLDGIQDPGNLGTLLRSAMAFGVDTVILTGDSVEPMNPKVIRASAGLVFALPVLEWERKAIAETLNVAEWTVYTTTGSTDALPYREADYAVRCIIALGNEGRGVSPDLFPESARPLTIPMADKVESLNVAVSGSIIMAEAAARRKALQTKV